VESADAIFNLARRYLDLNRPDDALRALDRATGDDLDDPVYWALRSEAYFGLSAWDEGARAASNGLALDPESTWLLNNLALCRLNAGAYSEAESILGHALELDPDSAFLLTNLALARANMRQFFGARSAVSRALELEPADPYALHIRALIASMEGAPQTAAYVEELLQADPEDSLGHELRGELALERRHFAAARRAFDEAARLEPGDQATVERAREARYVMHPLFAPLRPIWRFGTRKSAFVFIGLWLLLAAVGLNTIGAIVILSWAGLVIFSRLAPPAVRWLTDRR
jgi:tetratricopeptide (TPR) repeat protein